MSREFPRPIIGHVNAAFLARSNGAFVILGNGAAAACNDLVDDQRRLAYIGKRKGCLVDRIAFLKSTEVIRNLIEFDFCLILCDSKCQSEN